MPFVPGPHSQSPPSRLWLAAGCAALAFGFGVLPAALCSEGVPHALRSMGAWPAVALFTGATLSVVWSRSPLVPVLALALAVAQTVHFVPYYFRVYPKISYDAWGGALREGADRRDIAAFTREVRTHADWYDELGIRYYLIRDFGETCASSRARAAQIIDGG